MSDTEGFPFERPPAAPRRLIDSRPGPSAINEQSPLMAPNDSFDRGRQLSPPRPMPSLDEGPPQGLLAGRGIREE